MKKISYSQRRGKTFISFERGLQALKSLCIWLTCLWAYSCVSHTVLIFSTAFFFKATIFSKAYYFFLTFAFFFSLTFAETLDCNVIQKSTKVLVFHEIRFTV